MPARRRRSASEEPLPTAARLRGARRALLAHYDRTRRDLPWRATRDPYGIWVSEVMLQQTRVETVRERWGRFLESFPDVPTLAAASEDRVLKAWEGLGYYRRARDLRRAARVLVEEHGGGLPDDPASLRALPGFGEYTTAAVGSIAFGHPVATVDGNVERVLARWLDEARDVKRQPARARIREVARRLVDPARAGDFNQALMELGATVCTPREPRCPSCPVGGSCAGRASGRAPSLPARRRRKPSPHHDVAAGIVWRGGKVLIARRPADGLLGGLWEFPGGKRREGESLEATCAREIREETGLRVRVRDPFMSVKHAYSHFRITLHVFHCDAPRGRPRALACESPRFVALESLGDYAFPTANRRVLTSLLAGGREG